MTQRPNFYQVLDLDPSIDDWATIEARLVEKKRQWSRDRTMGNPRRKREAARGLDLVEEIESVLKDAKRRKEEARAEAKRRKAEKEQRFLRLDNAIAVVKSRGGCNEAGFKKLCKQFQRTFSSEEIERRLRTAGVRVEKAGSGEKPTQRKRERIDSTRADSIRRNLDLLGQGTLYDFLGLQPQSSAKALEERAAEIYRENQRLGRTTPEASAQNELAGICERLFRSDGEKAKYDAHLAVEAMDGLKGSIEMAGHDRLLSPREMDTLVRQARNRGVSSEDALDYLEDYAARRKWVIQRDVDLPSAELRRCGFCSSLAASASASLCTKCGEPLSMSCPKCNTENSTENASCGNCGFHVGDAPLVHGLLEEGRRHLASDDMAVALQSFEKALHYWPDWEPALEGRREARQRSEELEQVTHLQKAKDYAHHHSTTFDVFLSHNSRDKSVTRLLAEDLHERRLKVWLDEWELIPGRPWQEALEEIIESTKAAAVLVGKNGLGPWEDHEMRACLSEFVKRRLPVIPVLLPGAPRRPRLPLFLRGFTWVDMRNGITADALLQLECGILGVTPKSRKAVVARTTTNERLGRIRQRHGGAGTAQSRECDPQQLSRGVIQKVYGIDFGTTYSCIAHVDKHGAPVVLQNADGDYATPSVVYFESDRNIVVGQAAKEVAAVNADQCVSAVKRAMGDPAWEREFFGQPYKPQQIASFIIRKLVQGAEQLIGERIEKVVMTCPSYFGINEREATKQAGELAELEVLYVIPEPTAAALAYGMEEEDDQVILVFDLGGGTFDATVLEIQGGNISIVCTRGDHELGGADWDDAIVRYFAESFEEETGASADALLDDVEIYQELLNDAERCKKSISTLENITVPLSFLGERVKVELSREKFNDLTSHLIIRALSLTEQVIDRAKEKGFDRIDKLLLVGGSTYMPQVIEAIESRIFLEVHRYDPNQAVAKGAAIFGFKSYLDEEIKVRISEKLEAEFDASVHGIVVPSLMGLVNKRITNVASKSFGLIMPGEKDQRAAMNLIKVDDLVPRTVTQRVTTVGEDLSELEFEVVENLLTDDQVAVEDCVQVGKARLEFGRPLAEGSPIEITFELGVDGVLKLSGRDLSTGKEVEAEFKTDAILTREDVEAARSRDLPLKVS